MLGPHATGPPVDVLIADNDPDFRCFLRRILERQGYVCAEAENGLEALQMARQTLPRIVFLDWIMADLVQTMRQLRADPTTRSASIHCLAIPKDRILRRQVREAGCDGFLKKPVPKDTLLDLVSIAMYSRCERKTG